MKQLTTRSVRRFENEQIHKTEDVVATEYPLTIQLNGQELATIVCTPTYLEDMVIGFLASEKLIGKYEHVKDLRIDEKKGFATVQTSVHFPYYQQLQNKRYITSCCGLSRQGFVFANDALTVQSMTEKTIFLTPSQCFSFMEEMNEQATLFHQTGGVHIAALCDEQQLLLHRTDIGRHNALDKIYGYCLRQQLPIRRKIIVFSGRISSEILLKVAKIGGEIVLSKSAPTDLALSLAEELGITTVGFIRGKTLNIYTHPDRIQLKT